MIIARKFGITAFALVSLAGIAYACSELPMPPIPPIKVSLGEIPKFKNYANPANAAFMKKLDGAASKLLGESNWVNNSYKGYVSYTVSMLMYTGRAMVYIEKPCGKKAEEMAEQIREQASQGGGGGGGGVNNGSGGGVLIGGGCYGSCGGKIPVVDVGPPDQIS
ncbi:hypothetical protein [Xanthomonas theicola]|uniref:Lipoprotein n=1 Tax=Xanthomonas theicola TaxID=56464 RepID=A0A2S6ZJE6_9XANT|nr:hypothetical protein [Xanthomonas theicola]PPT92388.1 hypothetical protein XthCFBP4691_04000 [Xanthomonas theicola]QNH25106.1 hypothetical protein G4Q83_10645 [Xanthomonas theicola]